MEISDALILKWYKHAWKNEGNFGDEKKELRPRTPLQETSYIHGSVDYIAGDDNSLVDCQTDQQIINSIRKSKNKTKWVTWKKRKEKSF